MNFLRAAKKLWPFKQKGEVNPPDTAERPLREFVYLDEVSLRSLLSSQTGGVTESMSRESLSTIEAELGSRLEAGTSVLVKSEVSSRFQTSNSSSIQTSRKATVQSWFVELLALPGLRKIFPAVPDESINDIDDIKTLSTPSTAIRASDLCRGDLVEFQATLVADPVFRLETMVTEFAGMAEDYPEMFGSGGAIAQLKSVLPVNKVLQRLLAGLIPVRARALHHVVIEIGGEEFVVHRRLIEGHVVTSRPLEIVGVTEHLAYWKDIRRVLFSDGVFNILARVSRPGLYDSWTPVKLVDLFSQLTPDLVAQISEASLIPLNIPADSADEPSKLEHTLEAALKLYVQRLASHSQKSLTEAQVQQLDRLCEILRTRSSSLSDQSSAFRQVRNEVSAILGFDIASDQDLAVRNSVRDEVGLSWFPLVGANDASPQARRAPRQITDERLLDVEIVAIYW
tara:strand:+ start:185 stop:1546 length:1362 start_codon:yes stop_codon:yes gene_type:complete